MQEIQQRHINVPPEQIAKSIGGIESRNGMAKNALRDRLAKDQVSLTTLIDQIRVQLAWSSVLREQLGDRARISAADIRQRQDSLKRTSGEPEYDISEIFVPVDDPKNAGDALKFASTIIQQLHDGAPFAIVAAQFSQSQTALDGGTVGWVRADTLDPQVVSIVNQMPIGAISDPIRVAGGYEIVTLAGRRQVGRQMTTVLDLRQAFIGFDQPLNPQAPTPQQQAALAKAVALAKSAHDCDQIAAANKSFGEHRPSDPGRRAARPAEPADGARAGAARRQRGQPPAGLRRRHRRDHDLLALGEEPRRPGHRADRRPAAERPRRDGLAPAQP